MRITNLSDLSVKEEQAIAKRVNRTVPSDALYLDVEYRLVEILADMGWHPGNEQDFDDLVDLATYIYSRPVA